MIRPPIRRPHTRKEFFDLTKRILGIGLTFTGSLYETGNSGEFRIVESPKKFLDSEFSYKMITNCFGQIYAGGVLDTQYGQFAIFTSPKRKKTYREGKRLMRLFASTLDERPKSNV